MHVIKMILETAQLLSCAHIVLDDKQVAYKKTHQNHPSSVWVRESRGNYFWTFDLLNALLAEYEYRFNGVHATARFLAALSKAPDNIPDGGVTAHVMAMGDEFRIKGDPFLSYQGYIRQKLVEWRARPNPMRTTFTRREVPLFLEEVGVWAK